MARVEVLVRETRLAKVVVDMEEGHTESQVETAVKARTGAEGFDAFIFDDWSEVTDMWEVDE